MPTTQMKCEAWKTCPISRCSNKLPHDLSDTCHLACSWHDDGPKCVPVLTFAGEEREFHCTWDIDVTARNHVEAAKMALKLMRGRKSAANVFTVTDGVGKTKTIDLQEEVEHANVHREC